MVGLHVHTISFPARPDVHGPLSSAGFGMFGVTGCRRSYRCAIGLQHCIASLQAAFMEISVGVPYGSRARLIVLYLQSEALKTNSREVELGKTLRGGSTSRSVARAWRPVLRHPSMAPVARCLPPARPDLPHRGVQRARRGGGSHQAARGRWDRYPGQSRRALHPLPQRQTRNG